MNRWAILGWIAGGLVTHGVGATMTKNGATLGGIRWWMHPFYILAAVVLWPIQLTILSACLVFISANRSR